MSPEKLIKYSAPIFVFAIVSRAIEEISFFYYAVPVMCVVFIVSLLISPKFKVQTKSNLHLPTSIFHHPLTIFLIPGIWFLLTSIWSSYPEISATRALYFILISTGCIAAGILWLRYSGKGVLDFLLPANIFIVLLCLFSLITNIPPDSWTGGHGKGFMGFFGHQNALASVLLFTMPGVLSKLIGHSVKGREQKRVNSKNHLQLIAYSLLLIANLLFLTLSYSRASILSLIFGVVVFLLLSKKWKTILYSTAAAALVALIIFITPSLKNLTDNLIKKDFPEFYSSRVWMWEPSYHAALSGGIIGLGYGISDPNEKVGGIGDHFEGERFIREKGNSILALVEETGIVGVVLFLLPIIFILNKFRIYNLEFRMKKNNYTFYIIHSSLAAMLLHSQFEAWWVGVGSVQLPLFFIYFGLLVNSSKLTS